MNSFTQLDQVLSNIPCDTISPIQHLLGIVHARALLEQAVHSDSQKDAQNHVAELEMTFITKFDEQENSPEKKLLHVMIDLRNHILSYQKKNISAYECHQELKQVYSLLVDLTNRCNSVVRSKCLVAKLHNEEVLAHGGYSYEFLLEVCDGMIDIITKHI